MNLLVDTHLILWAASDPERLPTSARPLLDDPETTLMFSAASIWEIAIKSGLGREDFHADPGQLRRGLLDNGWVELPITAAHAVAVTRLPAIHKDPFDRMLLAQADVEGIALLTADENSRPFPWAGSSGLAISSSSL